MTAELYALEIERRLTKIEATLEAKLPTFATKADLHALETRLIKWMVGSVLAAAMVTGTIVSVVEPVLDLGAGENRDRSALGAAPLCTRCNCGSPKTLKNFVLVCTQRPPKRDWDYLKASRCDDGHGDADPAQQAVEPICLPQRPLAVRRDSWLPADLCGQFAIAGASPASASRRLASA